jgi:carbonic anhydrase
VTDDHSEDKAAAEEHGLGIETVVNASAARTAKAKSASTDSTLPGDVLDDVLNGGTLPPTTTAAPTTTVAPTTTTPATTIPRAETDRLGLPANAFTVAVAACIREIAGEMRVRGGECPAPEQPEEHGGSHSQAHWSYEGETGEAHWADLSDEYSTCAAGHEQSPIDLTKAANAVVDGPEVRYNATAGSASDNGHTLKVVFDLGSSIEVRGSLYRLAEVHYHAHSEHTLDGKKFPVELHFVHRSFDGDLAVIGVLAEEGAMNKTWEPLISALVSAPRKGGTAPVAKIALQSLIEEEPSVYRYSGSLTTPPCSEGVLWSVLTEPIEISTAQIAALTKRYDANARSVQPLKERQLLVEKDAE